MTANSSTRWEFLFQAAVLDLRSLALFRALLGLYVLYDLYDRVRLGRYDLAWYTSHPEQLSYQDPVDSPHNAVLHTVWFYRGSVQFQILSFVTTAVVAICFCVGWHCRSGTVQTTLFVSYVAIQNRNMLVHDGSDSFVRHLVFWSCFLPVSDIWSFDAAAFNRKNVVVKARRTTTTTTCSSLACLAVTIQIALVYLGTVFHKTLDRYSWNDLKKSEWMPPSLSAVHYALSGSFATRTNFITEYIRSHPTIGQACTLQSVIIELLAPAGCVLGGLATRHWFAASLFLLHAGLLMTLNLPNSQLLGMLSQVIWIPPHVWDGILLRLSVPTQEVGSPDDETTTLDAVYKKTDGDVNSGEISEPLTSPPATTGTKTAASATTESTIPHRAWVQSFAVRRTASLAFQWFWFLYMIYNWMGHRGWINQHDGGDIGEAIRLSQYWVMFATVGKMTHNVMLTGYAPRLNPDRPDMELDLLYYLKTSGKQQYRQQQPSKHVATNMTDQYPSPRWERALYRMAEGRWQDRAIRLNKALCVMMNSDRAAVKLPALYAIELRWKHMYVYPPGSDVRYDSERYVDTVVYVPCRDNAPDAVASSKRQREQEEKQ